VIDKEPVKDLNREDCSTEPDAVVSEPLNDLKIEDFSARLEAKVKEPLRPRA